MATVILCRLLASLPLALLTAPALYRRRGGSKAEDPNFKLASGGAVLQADTHT